MYIGSTETKRDNIMINSKSLEMNPISLPMFTGEKSMIPFDLKTLAGLPLEFVLVVKQMLSGVKNDGGEAFFTIHGKQLKANETLRRGAPHTDGNYEPVNMSFGSGGGGGWKIGENGPGINTSLHSEQYLSHTGGIVLASNFESCLGWNGDFEGEQEVGGDCRHIKLNKPFMLKKDTVYYGNNHFIHESLPVSEDVHRVFARITMPINHEFH
ncbi:MAG: hypothetical protein JKY89_13315 [Immundisolibacteraceae bacterium]|nr:hypothetical protein [Immundisolibacteraceae bacterium]